MAPPIVILNQSAVHRVLTRIAHEIAERNDETKTVAIDGIQTGGVHLARPLAAILEGIWSHAVPVGPVDVSMHRDDRGQHAAPKVQPTDIPFDLNGKTGMMV